MHFYEHVYPGEFVLMEMEADVVGGGRGVVSGRIWSKDGKLAAVCRQEGVIRIGENPKARL